jgi:heat shock protein HspQ
MQVGDLVKHKKNGFLGIVCNIAMDPHKTAVDNLYHIIWGNGAKGTHWKGEIEVINASR